MLGTSLLIFAHLSFIPLPATSGSATAVVDFCNGVVIVYCIPS